MLWQRWIAGRARNDRAVAKFLTKSVSCAWCACRSSYLISSICCLETGAWALGRFGCSAVRLFGWSDFPPACPVLAGPAMARESGIRASDCLSRRRVRARPPLCLGSAGCPKRSAGTQTVGSPSFAFFSWRRKKRRCPAGGTSRHPPLAQACKPISEQAPASTSSDRTGGGVTGG